MLQEVFTDEDIEVAMAKVRFRTLKINNLAVDVLEEVIDDKFRDEVDEPVW